MARHKDEQWNLPEGVPNGRGGNSHSYESIHASLLMDIRDEMKRMNAVLNCANFLDVPRKLDRVVKNTTRRKRAKRIKE